jgi:hypothetical protein
MKKMIKLTSGHYDEEEVSKIKLIKTIREAFGLGLKEAKDAVDVLCNDGSIIITPQYMEENPMVELRKFGIVIEELYPEILMRLHALVVQALNEGRSDLAQSLLKVFNTYKDKQ